MQSISKKVFSTSSTIGLVIFSIVFACWVIYIQRGWVTDDSILYFEMARHISHGDFASAYALYNWIFYAGLIAGIHVLTGLDFQVVGQLLSVSFFAMTVWGLGRLVAAAGGDMRTQYCAVFLLLGGRYIVGDILPMAIRDQGYWAFMLLALSQLILYLQSRQFRHAFGWQVLAMISTLFRIEGAIFLMVLPLLSVVLLHWHKHATPRITFKHLISLYGLLVAGAVAAIGLWAATGYSMDKVGRLAELLTGASDIYQNVMSQLVPRVDVMRDQVIGEPFKEFAWFTFVLSLVSIVVIKCLSVAGWAPVLLSLCHQHRLAKSVDWAAMTVMLSVMGLSWAIACLITLKVNILSGRYVVLFGLMLVVLASFSLQQALRAWRRQQLSRTSRAGLLLAGLLVVAGFAGAVWPKSEGYDFEIRAVHYVHQQLAPGQQALYTTPRQRYYAGVSYVGRGQAYESWKYLTGKVEDGSVMQYQYLVIPLNNVAENAEKEQWLTTELSQQFKLDQVFYGHKKKKRILVYKRH